MSKNPYNIVKTQDGSLSLEFIQSEGLSEHMHHSGGALEESLYIYYPALEYLQQHKLPLRILSIGLGTGLNEMLIAAHKLKYNISSMHVESFESEKYLTDSFVNWLQSNQSSLAEVYEHNLKMVAQHFSLPKESIKEQLAQVHLRPAIDTTTLFNDKFHAIFFDFFSSKINDVFWSEEFVTRLIQSALYPQAVFTTYAAKGSLKRVLQSQGFQLEKKSGFKGKRECTYATRM